jgi:hypothetical protein
MNDWKRFTLHPHTSVVQLEIHHKPTDKGLSGYWGLGAKKYVTKKCDLWRKDTRSPAFFLPIPNLTDNRTSISIRSVLRTLLTIQSKQRIRQRKEYSFRFNSQKASRTRVLGRVRNQGCELHFLDNYARGQLLTSTLQRAIAPRM